MKIKDFSHSSLNQEILIGPLLKEIYSKPAPSKMLNDITFTRLSELESIYTLDHEALWIGSIIADLFIHEARQNKDIKQHLPLAIKFAEEFLKNKSIQEERKQIILEIIRTHHGGEQISMEAKIFKIADCHKFLEPAGLLDLISDYYKVEEFTLNQALELALAKLQEKYELLKDLAELDKGFDIEGNYKMNMQFLKSALNSVK